MADGALDDLALLAELGCTHVRLTVPWTRLLPRPDSINGTVVEHIRLVCETSRQRGLEPWLQLLEPAVPNWFDDEGGFTDHRAAGRWWPRYTEVAADVFGDLIAGWVPFEAPFAMAKRLVPLDDGRRHGELMETLVVAWRDAWRILAGGPPVACSLDVATPQEIRSRWVDPDGSLEDPVRAGEARREEDLRWLWMRALRDGVLSIPGRTDRRIADLAGSCDVIGLAVRSGVETCLYRAAERGPERPLCVTYRVAGDSDRVRADRLSGALVEITRAADELPMAHVTFTPFTDGPAGPGLVTARGEVTDAARIAFNACS
jgi:hypothetical protein